MVRHIILWNIRGRNRGCGTCPRKGSHETGTGGASGQDRRAPRLEVVTRPLPSCNADVMLKKRVYGRAGPLQIISSTRSISVWAGICPPGGVQPHVYGL